MKKIKRLQWGGNTNFGKGIQLSSTTQANMAQMNGTYNNYNPQPIHTSLPPMQTDNWNFSYFNNSKPAQSGKFGFSPEQFDYNASQTLQQQAATQITDGVEGDNGGNPGSNFGSILMNAGPGINAATTLFGKQYDDAGFQDEQTAINIAGMFGPWGALGGAIAGVSSQVTRAADINTSKMSERARNAAGVSKGAKFGNNVLSWLNNQTWGLYGGPAISKTNKFSISQESDQLSGAYSGTLANMRAAEDAADSRFFFGQSKLNNLVKDSARNDQLLSQIGIDNEQRVSSVPYNAQNIASRNFKTMNGMTGQNYSTRVGKEGMKMLSREELDRIYAAKKVQESDVQKFENGGSIMIPDGKLHANLHHMEDINPDLAEDLTKKGIPVVVTDDKGEVTQVAEIEKEEIILEKSLTEKIEKLRKDCSEEAMIEAGKLIVCALLNDSTDNAGLINSVA